MKLYDYTYDNLIADLKAETPVSLSRHGDGEWACILGKDGGNCDGHRYFPEMGEALRRVLERRGAYYKGMQPKAIEDMGFEIDSWLDIHLLDQLWCNADIIHNASIESKLKQLTNTIRGRKVVLVGAPHLAPLAKIHSWTHIETPPKNAWLAYEYIKGQCLEEGGDVVMFSCGMMANVLIDDLWHLYGDKCCFIDTGSVFDPMVGVATRRYHRGIIKREKK